VVRDLISGPLDRYSIDEARGSLREVIYKQGLLKQGIAESKEAMKEMMVTFVENLDGMAISTSEFHDRIADYSQTIRDARSIGDLNRLLQEVLQDTGQVQQQALRARDHLIAARQEVDAAEQRILRLEQELQDVSGLVRVDQLTGALNRRGLDELFARELARTERSRCAWRCWTWTISAGSTRPTAIPAATPRCATWSRSRAPRCAPATRSPASAARNSCC
jgi:hypothetical protein